MLVPIEIWPRQSGPNLEVFDQVDADPNLIALDLVGPKKNLTVFERVGHNRNLTEINRVTMIEIWSNLVESAPVKIHSCWHQPKFG